MPRRLSAEQIASFKVDGFLPVHDVVSAGEVAELADYVDRVAAGNVTAWTAIDEATSRNGCLNFAAGIHRWGMVRKERLEPFIDQLGSDPWPVVEAPLRPGDVSSTTAWCRHPCLDHVYSM
ncbi:MAG: phytanoyl-CoA dioxygenase family protein [Spirochaetaceae bacterium]|nr:phytanoyl-CoA dioxygenase family protein [Spirochaetaceae bacterium]